MRPIEATSTLGRWRSVFGDPRAAESTPGAAGDPRTRLERARGTMLRLVAQRFGNDAELRQRVADTAALNEEALRILEGADVVTPAQGDVLASLEVIVCFDGTRPSFLVRDNGVDFESSLAAPSWRGLLEPFLPAIEELLPCVGRVDAGGLALGTCVLIAPTLAMTNRHVAQAIGAFAGGRMKLTGPATVDFGYEKAGAASFDPRVVKTIAFAGRDTIAPLTMTHDMLDLAVLELSPSALGGAVAERHAAIGGTAVDDFAFAPWIAVIGYPASPRDFVPAAYLAAYEHLILQLLDAQGGFKRLAPGRSPGLVETAPGTTETWKVRHDATTLAGNSGSPLMVLDPDLAGPRPGAGGLHHGGIPMGEARTNWAHVLTAVTDAVGYGDRESFGAFLHRSRVTMRPAPGT